MARSACKTRVIALAAAVALVAAAASGCGASSTVDPVADAAQVTGLTRGAQVSMTLTMTLPTGQTVMTPGVGAFDFRGRRGRLSFDFSSLSSLTGGRLGGAHPTLRELIVYPDIYMRAPFLTKSLPGGKQWLKIDVQAAARRLTGVDPTQLSMQNGPGDQLQQLRAASAAHVVGRDVVRGVATTHYHGTVDLRRLPDRLPAAQRAAARQGIDRLIALTGSSSYPVDVWVDAHRRILRERQSMSLKVNGQRVQMTIAMDLFDYGTQVAVTPPPASQVFDATSAVPAAG